jgi:hypothetical protein
MYQYNFPQRDFHADGLAFINFVENLPAQFLPPRLAKQETCLNLGKTQRPSIKSVRDVEISFQSGKMLEHETETRQINRINLAVIYKL